MLWRGKQGVFVGIAKGVCLNAGIGRDCADECRTLVSVEGDLQTFTKEDEEGRKSTLLSITHRKSPKTSIHIATVDCPRQPRYPPSPRQHRAGGVNSLDISQNYDTIVYAGCTISFPDFGFGRV